MSKSFKLNLEQGMLKSIVLLTAILTAHAYSAEPIFKFESERAADKTFRIYNPMMKVNKKWYPIRVDNEAALALCMSKNPSMEVVDLTFEFKNTETVSIYSDGTVYEILKPKTNDSQSVLPVLSTVICAIPLGYENY